LLKTNEKSNKKDKLPPREKKRTPAKSSGPKLETIHIIPELNIILFVLAYNKEYLLNIK
jgi:hypothetical protein